MKKQKKNFRLNFFAVLVFAICDSVLWILHTNVCLAQD